MNYEFFRLVLSVRMLLCSLIVLSVSAEAASITKAQLAQELSANPKRAKSVFTQYEIDWCGTISPRSAAKAAGCARQGPPDSKDVRNAAIPTSTSPWKVIRVRFNILREDDGSNAAGSVADARAQIEQLNADYASARIRFVSTGVWYLNSSRLRYPTNVTTEITLLKSLAADQPESQMNIFVTDLSIGNLLGRGVFPWQAPALTAQGGFLFDDNAFGAGQKTATHEIGHCLGLWHPFHGVAEVENCGDGCYEIPGVANQDEVGDFCSDTPSEPKSFLCASPATNDVCTGFTFGTTDFRNFMGYADDACISRFTPQQQGRMRAWIDNSLTNWLIIDTAGPEVIVNKPAPLSFLTNFTALSGTASDDFGIRSNRVYFTLYQNGDYWNGSGWISTQVVLQATVNSTGFWNYASIPSGGLQRAGTYYLSVSAWDTLDNASTPGPGNNTSFTIDRSPPTVAFTTPSDGELLTNSYSVTGITDDSTGTSQVRLYILRLSDGAFWDGTAWGGGGSAILPTEISGNTWASVGNLPNPLNSSPTIGMPNGGYNFIAFALDQAGNQTRADIFVTVEYHRVFTWGGGFGDAWNNPLNWSPSAVPDAASIVVINGGTVDNRFDGTIPLHGLVLNGGTLHSSNMVIKNLTVNGAASLVGMRRELRTAESSSGPAASCTGAMRRADGFTWRAMAWS